jgi:hypothetical protein
VLVFYSAIFLIFVRRFFILIFCLISAFCNAQLAADSVIVDSPRIAVDSLSRLPMPDTISKDSLLKDSLIKIKDSLSKRELTEFAQRLDTSVYNANPFYGFKNPTRRIVIERQSKGKEGFFYSIVALLLFFAVTKNNFSRYLDDLFKVFFRTTLKQRQTREQLMGAPLPSLLFNILYAISAALFITLLLQHFHLGDQYNFWLLFAYSIIGLVIIYTIKYITLRFFGWVLGITEAMNTYIFIVFTTNKVIGISLLPFIIGLAFMDHQSYEFVFPLSICLLAALFLYRFYLSFVSIQKQVSINIFHFLLYVSAFEVVPLLLINKLLVSFFS